MPRRTIFFLKALLLVSCLVQPNHVGSTNAQSQTRGQLGPKPATAQKAAPQAEKAPDYSQEAIVIEALLLKASTELSNSRTIRLGAPKANVKGATEAQFHVALTPGPSRSAQVAEVKFIRGDEKLRPLVQR